MSELEKSINSVGGVLANTLNETVLGTLEGLIDFGMTVFGSNNEQIAQDSTGYSLNQEQIRLWNEAFSNVGKNACLEWG